MAAALAFAALPRTPMEGLVPLPVADEIRDGYKRELHPPLEGRRQEWLLGTE
ncbi:hypothetical protein [Streptomyces sp. NPDC058240]|uniref:hypothetical protein n=1 Tax=Streptomyces sp. NPDC058240 TaxID=3346396 RepID=UPI0036E9C9A9